MKTNLSRNSTFFAFLLLSIIYLIWNRPMRFEAFNSSHNLIYVILSMLNIIVFVYTTSQYYSSWIRYDVFFLLGYIIVHFQIPFLAAIGIEPSDPNFIWINKMVVNYATWLSSIALLIWMLGFLLYIKKINNKKNIAKDMDYRIKTSYIEFLLTISFILFLIFAGPSLFNGIYDAGASWGSGAGYSLLMSEAALYIRIIIFFTKNAGNVKTKYLYRLFSKNKLFVTILISYVLVFLLTGDRDSVLRVFLVILGAYSIFQQKISFRFLFFGIILGAITFTIIAYGRSKDGLAGKSVFSEGIKNIQEREMSFNLTEELAGSNRILYAALNYIPDEHPYLYGATMFSELFELFPFGETIFTKIIETPPIYRRSTSFFTYILQGDDPKHGDGSEILADIYINCGIYGIFILMFLFGYFLSSISFRAICIKKYIWVLIYLLILSNAIYINRTTFFYPYKIVIITLILNKIVVRYDYTMSHR